MLVVSDTSPIRALAHLGLLNLLPTVYGSVLVPPAVQAELQNPPPPAPAVDVLLFPFFQVQAPVNLALVQRLQTMLHQGEAEAIALAIEVQASAVLIDEALGRAIAQQYGLPVTGVLGVLVISKLQGLIAEVRPLMERLQNELRFFVSAKVRADILQRAGE